MRPGTAATGLVATNHVSTIYNWIKPGTQNVVGAPGGGYYNINGDFELQIDNPQGGHRFVYTPVAGVLIIPFFGWAVAGAVNTVTSVIIVIDGISPPGAVTIGIPRTDVAAARPGNAGSPNFGWSISVDMSGYAPGGHLVQIVATDSAANNIQAYGIFYITAPATAEQNLVIYHDGNDVRSYRQSDGANALLVAATGGVGLSIAPFDIWVYIVAFNTDSNGTTQVRITDGVNTDKAFRGPIPLTAVTANDAGPGFSTVGTHLFGFVYQNRTGYAGKPATTVFSAPNSFTLGSDNRKVDISATLPPLTDGGGISKLFLIMTRADNPAQWYFVPTDAQSGSVGEQPVPFNAAIDLPFVINISDADLAAKADSANAQFLLLSQDDQGAGPSNPSFVGSYGTRMFYGVGSILYVSDQSNPQFITNDLNAIRMPNQRKFGFAFAMPGSTALILTGDRWTAYVTDNNDTPSTWPPPISVSDALGAPFPNCVCARTAGNYAWIATESGVYLFNGTYSALPVTYLVADLWEQVRWDRAYAIQMADDTLSHRLYVGCVFGAGDVPNAMFVIDYTNGLSYQDVDVSLDTFNAAILGGEFNAVAVVKEFASGQSNVWIGPRAAGPVVRYDAAVRSDQGQAIESFWESGLARGNQIISNMIRVGYCDVWARGAGNAICWVYGPGKVISVNPQLLSAAGVPATLTPDPGIMYALKFDISKIENFTIRIGTFAVGAWWELSMLKPYLQSDLFNR